MDHLSRPRACAGVLDGAGGCASASLETGADRRVRPGMGHRSRLAIFRRRLGPRLGGSSRGAWLSVNAIEDRRHLGFGQIVLPGFRVGLHLD